MQKESKLDTWKRYQRTDGHKADFTLEVNGHYPEREIPPEYQGIIIDLPADVRRMFEYGWS